MDDEAIARRAFAVPPLPADATLGDDIDLGLLDPGDEDELALLIRAAHPDMDRALEAGEDEMLVGEQAVNIRLHLAIHQVVAQQLLADEPPEAWQTAQRLTGLGYDHHNVLHMLGSAVTGSVWSALHGEGRSDRAQHLAALDALPGDWPSPDALQPAGATPHRHAADRRRRRKAHRAAGRRNRR